MSELVIELLNQLQTKNITLAFITAGGGVGLYELFKIPGASKVMTEARMLYSKESFDSFLHQTKIDSYVTQDTANRLAVQLDLVSNAEFCFAFSCALLTDRNRKGLDRGYLSLSHKNQVILKERISVEGNNREEQDNWVTNSILKQIIIYFQKTDEAI
jgi:nicotinamide mononucleotide (NMN) deamidase PncC